MLKIISRSLCLILFFPALSLAANTTSTTPTTFEQGKDYQLITNANSTTTTNTKNKIQVVEFFSYGCPWCSRLEPELEQWLKSKPDNIDFQRVPVAFNQHWELLAKAYYTAEALGVEKKLTPAFFDAIHNNNIRFDNEESVATFFVEHGVAKDDFESAFNFSPGIDAQLRRGQQLMAQYGIYSVPTLVINGQYKTDTGLTNGDVQKMVKVLEFLIQKSTSTKS